MSAYQYEQQCICSNVKIQDVFNRYIGNEFNSKGFCHCPFHKEKTASFKLFSKNNSFYCFGCGAGGNVINLVQKYLNLGYLEAMKRLSDDYHLGLFTEVKMTETQRSKQAVEIARKQLQKEQIAINHKRTYYALINYGKWLLNQPENKARQHDLDFIDRLLDKWLSYDIEPFDRVPDDYNANALILALKTKFEKRG